jgi:hypothetical protein
VTEQSATYRHNSRRCLENGSLKARSMKSIGLDDSLNDIYENVANLWRAVWPTPMVFQAAFVEPGETAVLSDRTLIFREDSFDATTRIRRGRLYEPAPRQGNQSWALPHPAYGSLGSMIKTEHGTVERNLRLFDQYQRPIKPLDRNLAIGAPDSVWRVLAADRISTGETLVTVKAARSFGIIPQVNPESVPKDGRAGVLETVGALTEAIYRESPSSIVDRARDAAQSCLAVWAQKGWDDESWLAHDLGQLIKRVVARGKPARPAAVDAANLIRVLHARAKWNERHRRSLRKPNEDDAELALCAVGFLLQEFGWTF